MFQCRPLWVQFVHDSLSFLHLRVFFLHQIREIFSYSSNRLSISCSFCSPSGNSMMRMLLHIMLSKMFFKLSSFLKILILFAALSWWGFFMLSSKSLIRSSASSNLLFIPSSVLFISDIAFFISDWSFFMPCLFSCCWVSL